MNFTRTLRKDIFCLEGDWNSDLTRTGGVKPNMKFLSSNLCIDMIHRQCATEENLKYYLEEYSEDRYKNYTILFLAFHGLPGLLQVGKTEIYLEKIADICENKLKGKIVYFGSCLTLNIDKRRIKKFLEKTKAIAVFGYKDSIDFVPASVLDILVIETLQKHRDVRLIETEIKKYSQLIKQLKFRMVY